MQDTRLGNEADGLAPDGSQIRFLLSGDGGALNHFTLPAGATSTAVAHKTIEELWYFLSGTGQLWRRRGEHEVIVDVGPGVCLSIPTEDHFQFRSTGDEPLRFVVATMPPWPGDGEAYEVPGPWEGAADPSMVRPS